MSTAHRVLDGKPKKFKTSKGRLITRYVLGDKIKNKTLYLSSHVNHPCGVWVRDNKENYLWLHSLTTYLVKEFKLRNNKTAHKSEPVLLALANPPLNIPKGKFYDPPLAMPERFKLGGSTVSSYRTLYQFGKYHLAKWKDQRGSPYWYSKDYSDRTSNLGNLTLVLDKHYRPPNKRLKVTKRF